MQTPEFSVSKTPKQQDGEDVFLITTKDRFGDDVNNETTLGQLNVEKEWIVKRRIDAQTAFDRETRNCDFDEAVLDKKISDIKTLQASDVSTVTSTSEPIIV